VAKRINHAISGWKPKIDIEIGLKQLLNYAKQYNEEMYRKTYNKSSDSSVITDTVKLRHVPVQKSETYGIKSL
jgi:hypothetical protein